MKSTRSVAVLGLMALSLAGCGSAMRDMLERDTPQQQAAVRQDLTMPPDLRLPPPGSAPLTPEQPVAAAPGADEPSGAAMAPAPAAPSPAPTPEQDIYAKAGISLYKPDGTKKSDGELREELRQYHIAKKKQKNPSYGTVFNMGNIFSDE